MNLKRLSLEVLASYLSAQLVAAGSTVPVFTGAADYEDTEAQPQVRVLAQQWTFDPYNVTDVDETLPSTVLVEAGWWEGNTEIRILGTTQAQREAIEELLANILIGQDELAPGILTLTSPAVTIAGTVTTYQAPMTWAVDTMDWREELAFDDHRYSFIELETVVPALAIRSNVYTINDLGFEIEAATTAALADDGTPTSTTPDATDPNATATFTVDQNGNITPAP